MYDIYFLENQIKQWLYKIGQPLADSKAKLYEEKKDENGHRFALSAKRGKLLEKEKKRERLFWDIIHGLPFIHSKD